jgi:ankyrin repeat protein
MNTHHDSTDEYNQTPLFWAAKAGHEGVVRLLVEAGAVIDSRDFCGQTHAIDDFRQTPMRKRNEAVVKLLR